MAENNVTTLEEMKEYCSLGFAYSEEHSTETEMVFLLSSEQK
ncbi:hypothetical protein [Bacteroides sp. Phil13]|nr:hypothetical protein [Bacteroides sp. Phil13]